MFKGSNSVVALSINLRRDFEYLYVKTNILFCAGFHNVLAVAIMQIKEKKHVAATLFYHNLHVKPELTLHLLTRCTIDGYLYPIQCKSYFIIAKKLFQRVSKINCINF